MVEHGHRYTEGGNTCITSLIPMSPCIQLFLLAKWVAGFFYYCQVMKSCVLGVCVWKTMEVWESGKYKLHAYQSLTFNFLKGGHQCTGSYTHAGPKVSLAKVYCKVSHPFLVLQLEGSGIEAAIEVIYSKEEFETVGKIIRWTLLTLNWANTTKGLHGILICENTKGGVRRGIHCRQQLV